MKAGACERCAYPTPVGQADHGDGDHKRTAQIVGKHMVLLTPPQQRLRTITSEDLCNHAQPIDVRDDPGEGHQGAITSRQGNGLSERPPKEHVGKWIHRGFYHRRRRSAPSCGVLQQSRSFMITRSPAWLVDVGVQRQPPDQE
jgi:hypothetical protein